MSEGAQPRHGNRRADARRNVEAILDAAAMRWSRDPGASVAQIAADAGLGRITLYGHFPSRAELVDAVIARALDESERVLGALDLSGDPTDALARLIRSSWLLVAQTGSLMTVAADTLPPERMHQLHARLAARVEALIARGREEGAFRGDLPASWLVDCLHRIIHGAAADVESGRLHADDAAATLIATASAMLTAPGQAVPEPALIAAGDHGDAR